ncbi:hypothetical protein AMECASPLE_027818 [Ameca splendens]|uniref:Uncharacterized protein n=1 Tax=Ameca splendens TaxID=208324 RepID=A0ABV0Y548_9TELE
MMMNETPKSRVSKQDRHRRCITTPGAGTIGSSTTNTGLTSGEIWTSICKVLDAVSNLGVKIEEISQKIDALQEKVLTLPEGAQNMQFKTKIPKALSREIKRLHSALGEDMQYKGNESKSTLQPLPSYSGA